MTEPSARARQLLERYKAAGALSNDEKARLGGLLEQRALRGDLPRFDVQPHAANAAPPSLFEQVWSSTAAKLALSLIVAGAAGGVLYGSRERTGEHPSVAASFSGTHSVAVPIAAVPSSMSGVEAAAAADEPAPPPSSEAHAVTPPRSKLERSEPAASASEPTIDEEVKLMNAAQAALRAGDSKQTLELLRQHAARFPAGKLTTLRQVTHMLALCQAGQTARARQEASSFLEKNPHSPFSARVSGICAPHD